MRLPLKYCGPLYSSALGMEGDAAAAEAEPGFDFHVEAFLFNLVESYDAERCGARRHYLRDVIISHIEDFQREVRRFREEFSLGIIDRDSDFLQQGGAVFVETAL